MKKVVRIGKLDQQDEFRRKDCAKMTHKECVDAVLTMQANFLRWDLNPKIQRVGLLKMLENKNVS